MMAKKKTGAKENKSRAKDTVARPSGKSDKKPDDNAAEELMGVHVINNRDVENHFGASEIKTAGDASGQPAADRPKADVRLRLDAQVWQEAQTSAADAKLELSQYVERALERFKDDFAK